MPDVAQSPRPNMVPTWRAAAVAYRQARGEGAGEHEAHIAAGAAVQELHAEFTEQEAGAEVVSAVAYASSFHSEWFWAPLKSWMAMRGQG